MNLLALINLRMFYLFFDDYSNIVPIIMCFDSLRCNALFRNCCISSLHRYYHHRRSHKTSWSKIYACKIRKMRTFNAITILKSKNPSTNIFLTICSSQCLLQRKHFLFLSLSLSSIIFLFFSRISQTK